MVGDKFLPPLHTNVCKNMNIKMFCLIGSLHKEDFDFMEECLTSAVEVSEVAWVEFSLHMFLWSVFHQRYVAVVTVIFPITLFFVNSYFQHQSRIASSSNARTALLSHLKRPFNNHTKDILSPFLSSAASEGQLENWRCWLVWAKWGVCSSVMCCY